MTVFIIFLVFSINNVDLWVCLFLILFHFKQLFAAPLIRPVSSTLVELQESCRKASIICPESEIEALGGLDDSTPEQLSAHLNKLNQRLQEESQL